jgi:nucleoside 2-deoxyribosyltransferase
VKNIYLSGAMRGFKSANFPAFDFAADMLRKQGFEVFSPADNDRRICNWTPGYVPTDEEFLDMQKAGILTARVCFADDMKAISEWADTIAVLKNSEKSGGVAAELALAKALGLTIVYLGDSYHDERRPII